jgi:hypothetical protein
MQTLGLADSTPRSESRIKALLWPSIENATDVDYLGTQGLWLCVAFGLLNLLFGFLSGHEVYGFLAFLLYFLSSLGVRQGSVVAAMMVFLYALVDTIAAGPGMLRLAALAILLANIRGTWLASRWQPTSPEAELPPLRLNETFGDKISDQLPPWLWPKIRYFYYLYAFVMLVLITAGVIIVFIQHSRAADLP